MYDYREGELYKDTQDLGVKDIAGIIRRQLREVDLPEGCKTSVRYVKGRGYADIDIHIIVPNELMELRYEFEGLHDYTWLWHIDQSLMVGRFEPLAPLAQAYCHAVHLYEAYNFYEASVYGDGCSRRYFGGVTITKGDQ